MLLPDSLSKGIEHFVRERPTRLGRLSAALSEASVELDREQLPA